MRRNRSKSVLLVVVALIAIAMFATASPRRGVAADSILAPSLSVGMPDATARPLGFTTQVEMGAENSVGYVPVKITFNAIGTLAADRRFVYRFATLPEGQSPPRNGLTLDVPITVGQGTSKESFLRYLPKWSAGMGIEVSVWEDGRQLEDYTGLFSTQILSGRETRELLASEYEINWLLISSEDEVTSKTTNVTAELREFLVGSDDRRDSLSAVDAGVEFLLSQAKKIRRLQVVGQNGLPTDWRGYQRYDVAVAGSEALQRMAANEKELQGLRGWVLNGGTIVVYDAPSLEAALDKLSFRWAAESQGNRALQTIAGELASEFSNDAKSLSDDIALLQRYVDLVSEPRSNEMPLEMDSRIVSDANLSRLHSAFAGNVQVAMQELSDMRGRAAQRESQVSALRPEQIWMQEVGAGGVIGIQASDEFSMPPPVYWNVIGNFIGYHASPMIRRGVDPMLGDGRFSRWLIPGVAEPPVYTFMGLLTAFVVLVGPIAYRRTAKHGRSYLMFAIAPALALFTTVAMFGYGIVSDGFGTVVRVRQLTWVDGKSGDGGERVRATYFAGVRPAEGLRFAADAEVIGYPEGTGMAWRDLNEMSPATLGSVRIQADAQVFDPSFLPSRQQRQFVTHAPRYNIGHLQLTADPAGISSPEAENGFAFAIHEAVIRDRRGTYWSVGRLAPGTSGKCAPLKLQDASKALGRLYNDHRPLSKVRETSKQQQRNYDQRIYDVIVDANRQISPSLMVTDGSFEYWLQQHMQTSGEIPRDHFVAVADVSPDVLAVSESELASSVRYVFGTLR